MRILSKSLHYIHIVQTEDVQMAQDNRGVLRSFQTRPAIILEFRANGLTGYDLEFGLQHWFKSGLRDPLDPYSANAWGAHPQTFDDVMDGRVASAWRPQQNFSVYDTEWASPDTREIIEAHFNAAPEGQDYVVVTPKVLTPPWPAYPTMHASKIAPFAYDAGLLVEALAYERAMDARESVIVALEKKLQEAAEQAAEDAALRVITP